MTQTGNTQTNERAYTAANVGELRDAVTRIVDEQPVTDIHTHLYAPAFGELLLWGIDELLTYHYLIAEAVRASRIPYETYWGMSKPEQAAFIWQTLFVDRTPYSEACRGVVTVLNRLGLDPGDGRLEDFRAYFASQSVEDQVDDVFKAANLESVVMTNDPFDEKERPIWEKSAEVDPRFHAALRIDPLLNDWENAVSVLRARGYNVDAGFGAQTVAEVRRFLSEWIQRMNARYMAVSLPPDFIYPDDTPRSRVIRECILPAAEEHGIPFALMIGVKRGVNPALKLAGDGVGTASIEALERLCAENPSNKFMVTMLARENQHALCVTARKFPNLMLFGCWWFLNNPVLIEEITRMRFEMLGSSIVPQHSDARVLEQVLYKWDHSRRIIAKVLADKYEDLVGSGWKLNETAIRQDTQRLLGGAFWDFVS